MAIAGLHDKAVMDAGTTSADIQAKKTRMKHMGEFKETKTPVVIVFRTLPNDSENCLVVAPKFLPVDVTLEANKVFKRYVITQHWGIYDSVEIGRAHV